MPTKPSFLPAHNDKGGYTYHISNTIDYCRFPFIFDFCLNHKGKGLPTKLERQNTDTGWASMRTGGGAFPFSVYVK